VDRSSAMHPGGIDLAEAARAVIFTSPQNGRFALFDKLG